MAMDPPIHRVAGPESLDIDRQVFFIVSIRLAFALLIPPPPDKGVPAGIINFALAHRQEMTVRPDCQLHQAQQRRLVEANVNGTQRAVPHWWRKY